MTTLAQSTKLNKLRREISTRLSEIANNTSDTFVFDGVSVAPNAKLFKTVYNSRTHKSMIKPENYPACFISPSSALLEGNKSVTIQQTRTIEIAFVLQYTPKNVNVQSEMEKIEDIIDYYKREIAEKIQGCDNFLNGLAAVVPNNVDNPDTIQFLETEFPYPFWVGSIGFNVFIPLGVL